MEGQSLEWISMDDPSGLFHKILYIYCEAFYHPVEKGIMTNVNIISTLFPRPPCVL